MINLDKILKDGKALFLAYDHGVEHGAAEFSAKSSEARKSEGGAGYLGSEKGSTYIKAIDPSYILKIATDGDYTGVILHKGIAGKYYPLLGADERGTLPLIIKLNGKTNIPEVEPYAPLVCTVEEAVELGASAVGYTIYLGSEKESTMFWEFGQVVHDAHQAGIPAIGWIYPRGKWVKEKYGSDTDPEVVAYAARVGLELGADIVKLKYTGDPFGAAQGRAERSRRRDRKSFAEVVRAAGRTKVVLSGGEKTEKEEDFLQTLKDVIAAGAIGVAVGRNVWKSKDPLKMTEKIKKIVFA